MKNDNRLLSLIRADLITMNGGRNSLKLVVLIMCLAFGAMTYFAPFMAVLVPPLVSFFFVPMLFGNELKYHSERLNTVLPVSRRDIVDSRFILTLSFYCGTSVLFYVLMALAVLNQQRQGIIISLSDISPFYLAAFTIGAVIISGKLRKHFANSRAMTMTSETGGIRRAKKREYVYAVIMAAMLILLCLLIFSDVLPAVPTLSLIVHFLGILGEAAGGLLLAVLFLTAAAFPVVYKYICTVCEYEDKEL